MDRFFLRKSQRIVSDQDFGKVLSHKCFVCKGVLRLYAAANRLDTPRFGISVSKSCGNAVARNRLKRYGREAFRLHQHEMPPNFDYILIFTQKKPKKAKNGKVFKESAPGPRYQDIESAFLMMVQALSKKLT
ncbi:MAG: ribonuclease P protein component [Planctomycetota bacterium]